MRLRAPLLNLLIREYSVLILPTTPGAKSKPKDPEVSLPSVAAADGEKEDVRAD